MPSGSQAARSTAVAASATFQAPIALAEPASVCASAATRRGSSLAHADGQHVDLATEQGEHLVLERALAECHAGKMRKIEHRGARCQGLRTSAPNASAFLHRATLGHSARH